MHPVYDVTVTPSKVVIGGHCATVCYLFEFSTNLILNLISYLMPPSAGIRRTSKISADQHCNIPQNTFILIT
jgi:hypothetical protein